MIGNANLGPLDWEHDAVILGLSEHNTQLTYRIEEEPNQAIDKLLGPNWDFVNLQPSMDSYRLILTMEVGVTAMADLLVTAHAVTVSLKPEPGSYREQYLQYKSSETAAAGSHLLVRPEASGTISPDLLDQDHDDEANKTTSLLWDSFNPNRDPDRLSTPIIEERSVDVLERPRDLSKITESSPTNDNDEGFSHLEESTMLDEKKEDKLSPASAGGDISKTRITNGKVLSESGSSRPQSRSSRISGVSGSTTASRLRLQGYFQKATSVNGGAVDAQCPFPNEWQFGTVPEVITNDDDVD